MPVPLRQLAHYVEPKMRWWRRRSAPAVPGSGAGAGAGSRWRAGGPLRVSVDVPGADLAYTWRVLSMDPGAPGLAASARSGCRAGRFSRAV